MQSTIFLFYSGINHQHHLVLERKEFHSTLSDPTVPSSSTTKESLFVLTFALQKFKKKKILKVKLITEGGRRARQPVDIRIKQIQFLIFCSLKT